MHAFSLISIIITFAALFSFINARFFRKPPAILLLILSGLFACLLLLVEHIQPEVGAELRVQILSIDFSQSLLGILLSFLLFAGSMHVNFSKLRESKLSILIFSTIGTLISSFAIGYLLYLLLPLFHISVPFSYCLLFGCLISPTDPIAVMGILRKAGIKENVEMKIVGESLFNDGISVVLFVTVMAFAGSSSHSGGVSEITLLFAQEVVGGIIAGFVIGYIGYRMMKSIDHFQSEILISLAMVMGGYSLCSALHLSGPLAMVVAGLITGNASHRDAMSDNTRDYLGKFWEVVDEILNAVLFVMIGLQLLSVHFSATLILIAVIIYILLIFVRYLSLRVPASLLRFYRKLEEKTIEAMTWGGLRGGISIALALSIPENPYRDLIVTITFVIVALSILIQGFTIGYFIKRWNLNT